MKRLFFLICTLSLISCVQAKKQATPAASKQPPKPLSPLMDSKGTLVVQPEEIAQLVRSKMPEIQGCYNASLKNYPNSEGQVVMTWVIGPDGRLLSNQVAESTLPDPSVGQCLTAAAAQWTFPPPASYRNISITYPFIFKRSKK